jgi:hypothetical protein
MRNLTLLTWNIRASQQSGIIRYLLSQNDIDVFILSEYAIPKRGEVLSVKLAEAGWSYQASSVSDVGSKGVLVASRIPFQLQRFDVSSQQRTSWKLSTIGSSVLNSADLA